MILVVHISDSRIRASYQDHDMNAIHIPFSKGKDAYFLDPTLYIDNGFAFTGEYKENILLNNPEVKFPENLNTRDHFTLLFKYIFFKANAIVSDDFRYVFIVYPTHSTKEYIEAVKNAVTYNGLKWIGGVTQEEAIQSKLEGDITTKTLILNTDNKIITNNIIKKSSPIFESIKNQLNEKLIGELHQNFENNWKPLPIDRLRLSIVCDQIIEHLFLAGNDLFKQPILINNSAINISISNIWKDQIIAKYSETLENYLMEIDKSNKGKLSEFNPLILCGPFAEVPFILSVLLEFSDDWKDNYIIDQNDLLPIKGAFPIAQRFFQESHLELMSDEPGNEQNQMPSDLKNIMINNLVS